MPNVVKDKHTFQVVLVTDKIYFKAFIALLYGSTDYYNIMTLQAVGICVSS